MSATKPWENTPWEGIDPLALVHRLEALEREFDRLESDIEDNRGPTMVEISGFVESCIDDCLSDSGTIDDIAARIKDRETE
jgi:hypothetical protein